MFLSKGTSRRVPYKPAKVPEVHGRTICDEEGLAINAFVVEGDGVGGVCEEEGAGGEEVGMGDVLDVGEVEEVVVLSNLPAGLAGTVDIDDMVLGLDVALANDTRRTESGGQELGPVGAVGLEDDLLSGSL